MKRKNVQVTEQQNKQIKEEAFEKDCSEAEVVRKALDQYFKNQKEEKNE